MDRGQGLTAGTPQATGLREAMQQHQGRTVAPYVDMEGHAG
jgi:hypothetical protein